MIDRTPDRLNQGAAEFKNFIWHVIRSRSHLDLCQIDQVYFRTILTNDDRIITFVQIVIHRCLMIVELRFRIELHKCLASMDIHLDSD